MAKVEIDTEEINEALDELFEAMTQAQEEANYCADYADGEGDSSQANDMRTAFSGVAAAHLRLSTAVGRVVV